MEALTLIDLPLEIIETILDKVSSYHALLLTCHHLYRLVKPKIYRKIHLHLSTAPETIEASKTQLVLLCRTICHGSGDSDLDVARLVEEFDVQGSKPLTVLPQICHQEGYTSWAPPNPPFLVPPMANVYRWREEQLRKGNADVLIAVMISHMENMRILRLGHDIWCGSPCLSNCLLNLNELQCAELLAHSAEPSTVAYFEMYDTASMASSYDARQLEALLSLPRIEKVSCMVTESSVRSDSTSYWFRPESRPSVVKRLHLVKTDLQPSLGEVLRITPVLEEFAYDLCIENCTPDCFIGNEVDKALLHVQSTLQRLEISLTFFPTHLTVTGASTFIGSGPDEYCGIGNTMRSLVNCHCLLDLTIPSFVLLGCSPIAHEHEIQLADVVPPSLQRLSLTLNGISGIGCYGWTAEELVARVEPYVRGGNSDQLKVLELEVPTWDEESGDRNTHNMAACSRLANDCHDAGIMFQLRECHIRSGWNEEFDILDSDEEV